MQPFLGADFLLSGEVARTLFHEVAEPLPVVDLHTHLPARDISDDRVFPTLTELWLGGDHYKWRAMRAAGFPEEIVTGNADPWERFAAWAATAPRLIGSPLYLWTHLELQRVFGVDLPLSPATAGEIWAEANHQLPRWSARRLLERFSVSQLSTTDDPADPLDGHERLRNAPREVAARVLPTWRPDAAHRLLADPPAWAEWAVRLGSVTGVAVDDLESLCEALARSHRRFAATGSRASDHGVTRLPDVPGDARLADTAVRDARRGVVPDPAEADALVLEVVGLAARLARSDGSVLQLHLGARRDLSPRLRDLVGPDTGGDAVGDEPQGGGLGRFLAGLDAGGGLPRTVLYNSNPRDDALFATVAGAFSSPAGPPIQWGPPWWFNDSEGGMRRYLHQVAELGQLAGCIGMLSDARSFMSLSRHELFRRVLCDVIGAQVETGRFPADMEWLAAVVRGVCGANAAGFFGLPAAES